MIKKIKYYTCLLIPIFISCTNNECTADYEQFYEFKHLNASDSPERNDNFVGYSNQPVSIYEKRKLIEILNKREIKYIISIDSNIYISNISLPFAELSQIDDELRSQMGSQATWPEK